MKIVNEKPPIYDSIVRAFQVTPVNTVFTYGDTIYNPSGKPLPDHLIEHEKVHIKQQNGNDADAALWWGKFLRDPVFRLDQESEAYGVQYRYVHDQIQDRNRRAVALHTFAATLSGPLYNNCIGHTDAMALIKKRAKLS